MVILSDPSFLTSLLPEYWRVVRAWARSGTQATYILSPEGLRFDSLEAMKSHMWHRQELQDSKEQQRLEEEQMKLEQSYTQNILGQVVASIPSQNLLPASSFPSIPTTFSSISESPELTYESKIKRKVKALRNPFKNLRKTILKSSYEYKKRCHEVKMKKLRKKHRDQDERHETLFSRRHRKENISQGV